MRAMEYIRKPRKQALWVLLAETLGVLSVVGGLLAVIGAVIINRYGVYKKDGLEYITNS